jgi:hypothetical protein
VANRRNNMSKLENLNVKTALACFSEVCGEPHFAKLCNDVAANVGDLAKTVVSKSTGWRVGTKGRLVSKEGHSLQLPLNAPWATLLRFGMEIEAITERGTLEEPTKRVMTAQCTMPAQCWVWWNQRVAKAVAEAAKAATEEVVTEKVEA